MAASGIAARMCGGTAARQVDIAYQKPSAASLRMRPMRRYTRPMSRDFGLQRTPVDVLDYEVAQEQAVALGRMGRALENALARLRELDAADPFGRAGVCAAGAAHAGGGRRPRALDVRGAARGVWPARESHHHARLQGADRGAAGHGDWPRHIDADRKVTRLRTQALSDGTNW